MEVSIWHNCYDSNLKGLITRESFAHPAKMARSLCERIFDHGQARGYWKPGDLIVDPFGGIGTTGIVGAYRGYQVISVELEPKFIELHQANIERNRAKWERLGLPVPLIVQGDSRKLRDHVDDAVGAVMSPPFAGNSGGTGEASSANLNAHYPGVFERHLGSMRNGAGYGASQGQINAMPEGDRAAVIGAITSPPYADSEQDYAEGWKRFHTNGRTRVSKNDLQREANYGSTPGQMGALPAGDPAEVVGAITSPPWENCTSNEVIDQQARRQVASERGLSNSEHISPIDMGQHGKITYADNTTGQLGAEAGQTYWAAVAQVYQELYYLLPPSGACAIVCKDYVKKRQRVQLCDQTTQLLKAIGFKVVERCHAMLVKEQRAPSLFGGEQVSTRVERKSFFRRLAEKKGSPKIDYEEVIWAIKPK